MSLVKTRRRDKTPGGIGTHGSDFLMKQGDWLLVDFVGRIKSTGEIFDLTIEETAKKEGIHNPKQKYGPTLVIIGAHMMLEALDKELEGMDVGGEKEVSLGPEEGFGPKNLELIKIVSMGKFKEEKVAPMPGMFVNIDGMRGRIQSIAGGRVRVDFNHPLAGKDLTYWLRIEKKIEEPGEKVGTLLDHLHLEAEREIREGTLKLTTEKELPKGIRRMLEDMFKDWLPEIKKTEFDCKEKPKETSEKPQAEDKKEGVVKEP